MILCTPACCTRFACIADRCEDSCCVGWEIAVDSASLARYDSVRGAFAQTLQDSLIRTPQGACFRLRPDGRCALLNDAGLCELYIHLGKDALCQICADHPRFFEWYGPVKEAGLGLCCPEAARLWFAQPLPFSLVRQPLAEPEEPAPLWYEPLERVRACAFSLLQDPERSFPHRLALVTALCGHAQTCVDRDRPEDVDAVLAAYADPAPLQESLAQSVAPADDCRREVVELFRGLSALDPDWTHRLERCPAVPGWDPAAEPWLERFALYLVYRYFLKSCLDGNVLGRGKWMTAACLLLFALSRDGTDPVLLAREWSKNVEYCPANLDRLDLAVQKLSASSLLGMLVSL